MNDVLWSAIITAFATIFAYIIASIIMVVGAMLAAVLFFKWQEITKREVKALGKINGMLVILRDKCSIAYSFFQFKNEDEGLFRKDNKKDVGEYYNEFVNCYYYNKLYLDQSVSNDIDVILDKIRDGIRLANEADAHANWKQLESAAKQVDSWTESHRLFNEEIPKLFNILENRMKDIKSLRHTLKSLCKVLETLSKPDTFES